MRLIARTMVKINRRLYLVLINSHYSLGGNTIDVYIRFIQSNQWYLASIWWQDVILFILAGRTNGHGGPPRPAGCGLAGPDLRWGKESTNIKNMSADSRDYQLLGIVQYLFADHYHGQLLSQLNQAAAVLTLKQPIKMFVTLGYIAIIQTANYVNSRDGVIEWLNKRWTMRSYQHDNY